MSNETDPTHPSMANGNGDSLNDEAGISTIPDNLQLLVVGGDENDCAFQEVAARLEDFDDVEQIRIFWLGTDETITTKCQRVGLDAIFLDLDMAGVSEVRETREQNPEIPCIGFGEPEAISSADTTALLDQGITDVMTISSETSVRLLANRVYHYISRNHQRQRAERYQSEMARKVNLFDEIFRNAPASLYIKDEEARHLYMTDYDMMAHKALGKTDPEIYGETEFTKSTYQDDMAVINDGERIINKQEYNPESGEWTLTSKVPWYDEDNNIKGLIGISRIITEKKEYEQELERANERLERFASVVSHDLRNPINIAHGMLEMAQQDYDDERLERAQNAITRMDEIISDVLELAKLGTIESTEPTQVSPVVSEAWDNVDTKDATLENEVDCEVEADRSRFKQMFENLFRNAVEHAGSDVTVTVEDEQHKLHIKDDGPGLPDPSERSVFTQGYTTADQGTGFGLSIVKEIAEGHGWEVTAGESESGGAKFTVKLHSGPE